MDQSEAFQVLRTSPPVGAFWGQKWQEFVMTQKGMRMRKGSE